MLQREISDCKNSPENDGSKLRLQIAELEKKIRGSEDDLKNVTAQKEALSTEATELKAILEFKQQQLNELAKLANQDKGHNKGLGSWSSGHS